MENLVPTRGNTGFWPEPGLLCGTIREPLRDNGTNAGKNTKSRDYTPLSVQRFGNVMEVWRRKRNTTVTGEIRCSISKATENKNPLLSCHAGAISGTRSTFEPVEYFGGRSNLSNSRANNAFDWKSPGIRSLSPVVAADLSAGVNASFPKFVRRF